MVPGSPEYEAVAIKEYPSNYSIAELQKYSANSRAVFTNSEFSLKYIDVYGFDFDYTLAHYSKELHRFIYQQARDTLINKLNVCAIISLLWSYLLSKPDVCPLSTHPT